MDNKKQPEHPGKQHWQALRAELKRRGVRLDRMLPLYHAGGVCAVPEASKCQGCHAPMDHRYFSAITDSTSEPGAPLVLNAMAKCPACGGFTGFARLYHARLKSTHSDPNGPPPQPAEATLAAGRAAMQPAVSHNFPWMQYAQDAPRPAAPSAGPAGLLDLVALSRLASHQRGEGYAERAQPFWVRAYARWHSTHSTPSLLMTVLIAIAYLFATTEEPFFATLMVSLASGGMGWALYETAMIWSSQAVKLENRGPATVARRQQEGTRP